MCRRDREIENGGSYLPKGRYLLGRSSVEFLVRERRSYASGAMDRQRVLRSVFAGLLRYAQSCTLVDAAKLVPVSYTHLDVYKRQATFRCALGISAHFGVFICRKPGRV